MCGADGALLRRSDAGKLRIDEVRRGVVAWKLRSLRNLLLGASVCTLPLESEAERKR